MTGTINRQGQFKEQKKDEVCVWVYSLFTDVAGDYIKKPMKECTGEEITAEWLYHLGVPVEEIPELAEHIAGTAKTMNLPSVMLGVVSLVILLIAKKEFQISDGQWY